MFNTFIFRFVQKITLCLLTIYHTFNESFSFKLKILILLKFNKEKNNQTNAYLIFIDKI
jgi:hypothetical protein